MAANSPRVRSCFIIGPMKDFDLGPQARLPRLAREVIQPLLDEIENQSGITYRVQTPYDLGENHIMNDVIYSIDRADLVIADLTDSNPNVFYELGICHSLGRACISLMESRQSKIEFDLGAYRVFKVNLDDNQYDAARNILRTPLQTAHKGISDWRRFENPVIDFFRAPVTYISPAYSLAEGYYHNFVKPVTEAIIKRRGTKYIYDIGRETDEKPQPQRIEEADLLPTDIRDTLALNIVIPEQIVLAKHRFADRFRGHLPQALVEGDGRTYTCYFREDNKSYQLIDIPTTIRVLENAVDRRMRHPNTPRTEAVWQEVESQEIERFALNLQLFINSHDDNPVFSDRIRILRYDPERPADLHWLDQILNLS